MAIIATGSKTIIDLSDGKSLSAYLGSNQPRMQIYDTNAATYSPDWTTTPGKLVIILLALVFACGLTGWYSSAALTSRSSTLESLIDRSEPQAEAAEVQGWLVG